MENVNFFGDPDLMADYNLFRDLFDPANDYTPLRDNLVTANDYNFDPFFPADDNNHLNNHSDQATDYTIGNDYNIAPFVPLIVNNLGNNHSVQATDYILGNDNNFDLSVPKNDNNILNHHSDRATDFIGNDYNFDSFVPFTENNHNNTATDYILPDILPDDCFDHVNDDRLETSDTLPNAILGQKSYISPTSDTGRMASLPDCFYSFSPPPLPSSDWVPNPNYNTVPTVPWKANGFDDIDLESSDMARNSTISRYSVVPDRYKVPINIESPQNVFHRGNHLVEARTSSNPTLEPKSSQNQGFTVSYPVNITTVPYSNGSYRGTSNEIGTQIIGNPSSISVKENSLIQRSRTRRTKQSHISREEIVRHFNIPIARAAKVMNVSLTAFKMRCRQVGIYRWPQRKIRSIDSLISTVKELENINDDRGREIIAMLEEKRKQMLENPQVDMTDDLRKLRQMFFKKKYMKKRGKPRTYFNRELFIL